MKRIGWSILSLVVILVGCGGGGGGKGKLEEPIANLSGTWKVTDKLISNDCGDINGTSSSQNLKVVQNGNNLTVTDSQGEVFKGTISGDQISWNGSFPEDGGTTTITSMSLTVSADGQNLSGSTSWKWTDGSFNCSGKNSVTGNLNAGSAGSAGSGVRNVAGRWSILEAVVNSPCLTLTPVR